MKRTIKTDVINYRLNNNKDEIHLQVEQSYLLNPFSNNHLRGTERMYTSRHAHGRNVFPYYRKG